MKKYLLLLGVLSTFSFAATFNVTTTEEFRTALATAESNEEEDSIILASGIYNIDDDSNGTFEYSDEKNFDLLIQAQEATTYGDIIISGNDTNQVFNLISHKDSNITIKGITISNGSKLYSQGAAIYSDSNLVIEDSKINNNYGQYGAIYAGSTLSIKNTIFNENNGTLSKDLYLNSNTTIEKCTFEAISENDNSGASVVMNTNIVDEKVLKISQSTFKDNSKAIESSTYTYITNSIFTNNTMTVNAENGVLYLANNNFFTTSSEGIHVLGYGIFINNIFDTGKLNIIKNSSFYNNYIDSSLIEENDQLVIKKNNIQATSTDLSFLNDMPTDVSPTNNAGLYIYSNTLEDLFEKSEHYDILSSMLKTDILDNTRIYGGMIDIGVYEHTSPSFSDSAPFIKIISNNDNKIYTSILVDYEIELAENNTITEILIDKGDGVYELVEDNTNTSFTTSFSSQGNKTLKVKVTDDSSNITEAELIIVIEDMSTIEAIEYGKQLCINDPKSCNITSINQEYITNLKSDWSLLGTTASIDDMTIFDNTNIVWTYQDDEWKAYSSDDQTKLSLSNSSINEITKINSDSGFWIKKP